MFTQAWTKHLKAQEDKDRFYQAVQSAKPVLDRLKDMIQEKEFSMDTQEMSLTSYDNPNWAYRQAHQNGFRQCISRFKTIVDLDQKESTTNDPTQFIRT